MVEGKLITADNKDCKYTHLKSYQRRFLYGETTLAMQGVISGEAPKFDGLDEYLPLLATCCRTVKIHDADS
jgi:hypothetical protein